MWCIKIGSILWFNNCLSSSMHFLDMPKWSPLTPRLPVNRNVSSQLFRMSISYLKALKMQRKRWGIVYLPHALIFPAAHRSNSIKSKVNFVNKYLEYVVYNDSCKLWVRYNKKLVSYHFFQSESLSYNRQNTTHKLSIRTQKALEVICMKHCSAFYSGAIHYSWGMRES